MNYNDAKFNNFFIRELSDKLGEKFPQIRTADIEGAIQEITGNKVRLGVIESVNKKLKIDLGKEEINTTGKAIFNRGIGIPIKARAYLSSDQENLVDQTITLVNLDKESYDIGSDFDTTNHYFIIPVTGYYLIATQVRFKSIITDSKYSAIVKNGINVVCADSSHASVAGTNTVSSGVTDIVYCKAGDKITLWAYHNGGSNTVDIDSSLNQTFLTIHLLSV